MDKRKLEPIPERNKPFVGEQRGAAVSRSGGRLSTAKRRNEPARRSHQEKAVVLRHYGGWSNKSKSGRFPFQNQSKPNHTKTTLRQICLRKKQ